jgi:hypothetical protein
MAKEVNTPNAGAGNAGAAAAGRVTGGARAGTSSVGEALAEAGSESDIAALLLKGGFLSDGKQQESEEDGSDPTGSSRRVKRTGRKTRTPKPRKRRRDRGLSRAEAKTTARVTKAALRRRMRGNRKRGLTQRTQRAQRRKRGLRLRRRRLRTMRRRKGNFRPKRRSRSTGGSGRKSRSASSWRSSTRVRLRNCGRSWRS